MGSDRTSEIVLKRPTDQSIDHYSVKRKRERSNNKLTGSSNFDSCEAIGLPSTSAFSNTDIPEDSDDDAGVLNELEWSSFLVKSFCLENWNISGQACAQIRRNLVTFIKDADLAVSGVETVCFILGVCKSNNEEMWDTSFVEIHRQFLANSNFKERLCEDIDDVSFENILGFLRDSFIRHHLSLDNNYVIPSCNRNLSEFLEFTPRERKLTNAFAEYLKPRGPRFTVAVPSADDQLSEDNKRRIYEIMAAKKKLTREQREQLKSLGFDENLRPRGARFTIDEDDQIRRNWIRCVDLLEETEELIDRNDPMLALTPSTDGDRKTRRDFHARTKFFELMYEGFYRTRTLQMVIGRAKNILDPRQLNNEWTVGDINKLYLLVKIHGPKWNYIGSMLERTPASCGRQYRKSGEKRGSFTWKEDYELLRLICAVLVVVESSDIPKLIQLDSNELDWREILRLYKNNLTVDLPDFLPPGDGHWLAARWANHSRPILNYHSESLSNKLTVRKMLKKVKRLLKSYENTKVPGLWHVDTRYMIKKCRRYLKKSQSEHLDCVVVAKQLNIDSLSLKTWFSHKQIFFSGNSGSLCTMSDKEVLDEVRYNFKRCVRK